MTKTRQYQRRRGRQASEVWTVRSWYTKTNHTTKPRASGEESQAFANHRASFWPGDLWNPSSIWTLPGSWFLAVRCPSVR